MGANLFIHNDLDSTLIILPSLFKIRYPLLHECIVKPLIAIILHEKKQIL